MPCVCIKTWMDCVCRHIWIPEIVYLGIKQGAGACCVLAFLHDRKYEAGRRNVYKCVGILIYKEITMKQILCFGDSNTYGLVPGTWNRYDWNIRWSSILQEKLFKQGYRIAEEGLCGRTTVFQDPVRSGRKGTDCLPFLLETHHPIDIIILMLGTNDCKTVYNASAEVIGKGIECLLDQIKQKASQSKVVLVSPILLGDGIWEEEYDPEFGRQSVETSKKLPEVYSKIAKKHGIYYLPASRYASPSKRDREHLDEEGHRNLAAALLNLLEGVIGNGY